MFFHVDESGNSGSNLFDGRQPTLSYGVLSSSLNVDLLGKNLHRDMLRILDTEDIHANHLGVGKLTQVSKQLFEIQKKFQFNFDYYFIEKKALAVVLFFDSVFDCGLNEGVMWEWYWTPLRFLLLNKISELFDESLLKESYFLCTAKNIHRHEKRVTELLGVLKERANGIQDKRCKEIIHDALNFGISYPMKLDFGTPDKGMISPNSVGYQFVLTSIATRAKNKNRKVFSVVVDRQNQFNKYQEELHDIKHKFTTNLSTSKQKDKDLYVDQPLFMTFDKADLLNVVPDVKPRFTASSKSIGLQIVDVYLWLVNRRLNDKSLSPELEFIAESFLHNSRLDGISMEGMAMRYNEFQKMLPPLSEVTAEQHIMKEDLIAKHREKLARTLKN